MKDQAWAWNSNDLQNKKIVVSYLKIGSTIFFK